MLSHMRMLHFRSSFQFKLLTVFTLITGLASIIVTSLYIFTEFKEYRDNVSSQLNLRAEHLAEMIRLPLYAENRPVLQQIVEETAHIPEMQAVIISDRAGNILASVQQSISNKNTGVIRATASVQNSRLSDSPVSAITGGGEPAAELIGTIHLERGTEDLTRMFHKLMVVSISLAIGFWLSVSLLCYFVLKKVSKSFNALMQGIHTMKGGDLTARIDVVSDDEPGMVARAFNDLAVTLHRRDEENEQLHQDLQDREQKLKELLTTTERDTRTRLSMAAANAFLFAWDIDLATGTISYSDGVERVFDTDTLNSDFYDVRKLASHIHEQDYARIEALDLSGISFDEQFRIKSPDGIFVWIEIHGKAVYGRHGEPARVVGIGQNITERKQLEVAQRRVNAMAQDMAFAEERERYRIAGELHDQVGPNLLLCLMKLDTLRSLLPDDANDDQIEPIEQIIDATIKEIRSLTFQLRPPILSTAGLVPALKWLSNEFQDKYGLEVTITDTVIQPQMAIEIRSTLFQIVREALLNVVKHAGTKKATVSIEQKAGVFIVTVQDNGIGFDPKLKLIPKNDTQGFGMFSIGQKMEHIGGSILFDSTPGVGTLVTISVPEGTVSDAHGESQ